MVVSICQPGARFIFLFKKINFSRFPYFILYIFIAEINSINLFWCHTKNYVLSLGVTSFGVIKRKESLWSLTAK